MDIIVKEVMGANPVTYEFLRGGCFINILPIKVEDSENLYRYKQAFVETTDMDAIVKYEAMLRKQIYGTITRRQARLQLHKMGLLKTVEDNTRWLYEHYLAQGINTVFELNNGNHYMQTQRRMAKGIQWSLKQKD